MLWRWLMPASVTGRFPPFIARSSIAVTANLPLVVSLIACSGCPIPEKTSQLYRTRQNQSTILLSRDLAVPPAGRRELAVRVGSERFDLFQNQFDTLVQIEAVVEQTLHRLGHGIVLGLGRHCVRGEPELRRLLLAGLVLLVEDDARRDADRRRARGYVFHHHGVRADPRTV